MVPLPVQRLLAVLLAGAFVVPSAAQGDRDLYLEIARTPKERLDPLINRLVFSKSTVTAIAVARILRDPEPSMRVKAGYILGFFDEPRITPHLTAALSDEDWEVRKNCVYALGRIGTQAAGPAIAQRLADENRTVRLAAARALSRVGSRRTTQAILRALEAAGDDREFEIALLIALGDTGDKKKAVKVLQQKLESGSETIELTALRSLAVLGDRSARKQLLSRLTDPEAYVRRDAATILGQLRKPWARKALMQSLMSERDVQVRLVAGESLAAIGDSRGLKYLVMVADGSDAEAAYSATTALTRLKVPEEKLLRIRKQLRDQPSPDAPAGAPPFVDPLGLRDDLGDDGVPFARRVDQLSDHLLGLPYLDSPLGEGAGYDPDPLVRWDAVDCVTYVEQVLALANAPTSSSSLPVLLDMRYRDGRASFGSRNHLMMAQWVPVNIEKGYLRDVTREVGGDRVEVARKTITEEMWSHRSGVDLPLSKSEVPIGEVELPYIPLALFPEVMTSVPDGSLLIVVREDIASRPYRVTHLGFVMHKNGVPYLRHAAKSGYQKVVDELLDTFVRRNSNYTKWPVVGFNLLLPLENTRRVDALLERRGS